MMYICQNHVLIIAVSLYDFKCNYCYSHSCWSYVLFSDKISSTRVQAPAVFLFIGPYYSLGMGKNLRCGFVINHYCCLYCIL